MYFHDRKAADMIQRKCVSARIAAGWENPRRLHVEPFYRLTLESGERQLHDEDKS
jgi:hypothetical protein